MDIALAVEKILPAAEYGGSTTDNTKDAWKAVDWRDTRMPKPAWEDLEVAWEKFQADQSAAEEESKAEAQKRADAQEFGIGLMEGFNNE